MLKALNELLQHRIPVRKLKDAVELSPENRRQFGRNGNPAKFLITDGTDVYLEDDMSRLMRASDGQRAFAFILDMKTVHKDIAEQVEKVEKELESAS